MNNISLRNPYPNGVPTDEEAKLEPFMSIIREIRTFILSGERVYLKITAGERKGSIAYVEKFDPDYQNEEPRLSRSRMFREPNTRIVNASLKVILRWDKRRNRIKWSTCDSCEYLRGYTGPTVWEKFDNKAAAQELLKKNPILDRDGFKLNKGDRVLYINARYGSGASLDRGIIEEIKFNVQKTTYQDGQYNTVHVIIKNDNGSKSDIKSPNLSILKIPLK